MQSKLYVLPTKSPRFSPNGRSHSTPESVGTLFLSVKTHSGTASHCRFGAFGSRFCGREIVNAVLIVGGVAFEPNHYPIPTGTTCCAAGPPLALGWGAMPRDDFPLAVEMAEAADAVDELRYAPEDEPVIISPAAPHEIAKRFALIWHSTPNGDLALRRYCEAFYRWTGTHYAEVSRERIDAKLWEFLSRCKMRGPKGGLSTRDVARCTQSPASGILLVVISGGDG